MQQCPFCDKVYDESEYSHCPYCSGELEDDDVRKIVMKGIKLGKKNYESLLDAEIIVSIDKVIGGEVV